jgi:signal transduction histidine kinase
VSNAILSPRDQKLSLSARGAEAARVGDLEAYRILDTPAESEFDDIAVLASHVSGCPIAYVGFLDGQREWFKATVGFEAAEVPQRDTYCQFVVEDRRPLTILDSRAPGAPMPAGGIPKAVTPDGDVREVRFYVGVPIVSANGHVIGTLCVVDWKPRESAGAVLLDMLARLARQVSGQLELRRTNAALFVERDTFSILFEAAPAPLVLAQDGVILRVNYAFAAMVSDRDPASLTGVPITSFVEGLPVEYEEHPTESTVRTEIGGRVPVIVYRTRLRAGSSMNDLIAIVDITDRKEKERVLQEQRMRAVNAGRIKDTFLSLVSHDLRSPLSGIFTMLDLLARAGDSFSREELDEAIHDMRASAAVLVEMINQLLNIDRLQSGRVDLEMEDVDLRKSIEQVLLTLTSQVKEKRIVPVNDVRGTAVVRADPGLLREAVFNLVSNAIKFSPEGGRIVFRHGDQWVSVEDEGPGVPAEFRADLFRHEVKTSRPGTRGEPGTGLGMPLVADIMEAHGGRIEIDDEYTAGARFVLTFADR